MMKDENGQGRGMRRGGGWGRGVKRHYNNQESHQGHDDTGEKSAKNGSNDIEDEKCDTGGTTQVTN